jgi:hypothetical protein
MGIPSCSFFLPANKERRFETAEPKKTVVWKPPLLEIAQVADSANADS